MKITLHDEPPTPAPWEVRRNDPRLCIRGTEHLYSLVTVKQDGRDTIVRTIAENLTEPDAHLIIGLRNAEVPK